MKRARLHLVLLALCLAIGVIAQSPSRRVTVATAKGDTVEGVLRAISDKEVTLEVAGQPLTIPMENVRYISFAGKIETGATGGTTPTGSAMDRAFSALADLQSAAEIGVMRSQWNDRLLAAVPSIRAFTRASDTDWPDVKAAMEMAVDSYQTPLASLDNWSFASMDFRNASKATRYAKTLASIPEEKNHRETPTTGTSLTLGVAVSGRLGFGDASATGRPGGRGTGTATGPLGYVDSYILTVPVKSQIAIDAFCDPYVCNIDVTGPSGKAMGAAGSLTSGAPAHFKKSLDPGNYTVQIVGKVGSYTMTASVVEKQEFRSPHESRIRPLPPPGRRMAQ